MRQGIIVTSTNSIEGSKIENYLGVINTNVVVGTNIFSDIGASFTDFFGGSSESYEKKLEKIYLTATNKLKNKVIRLGGNGIVGLSTDFDEISGGGKSMFMISVSGTAVKLSLTENKSKSSSNIQTSGVSLDTLDNEIKKRQIADKVNNGSMLNQEEWEFLIANPIIQLADKIVTKYIESFGYDMPKTSETGVVLHNGTIRYFGVLEEVISKDVLYSKLGKNSILVKEILLHNNLFDPQRILEMIDSGEINRSINLLDINKKSYNQEDLNHMEAIIEKYDNLEDKGSIQTSKSLLGKEKEKYICPNGHPNNSDYVHCGFEGCSQNIKGLTRNQVEEIGRFIVKVNSLKSLI